MKNYLPTTERKQMFKYPSIYDPGCSYKREQHFFKFKNGYGASVIKESARDLYELAVITYGDWGWDVAYNTNITKDTERFKTIEEINDLLDQVKNLGGTEDGTN